MEPLSVSGGTMMSMTWMPMCGQGWTGAAASFLGMWTFMMAAMMLPSLLPNLWRHRRTLGGAGELSCVLLTVPAAAGYFLVWTLIGAALYPTGSAIMALIMRYPVLARAAPFAIGVVVVVAGALQFTRWRSHHLECCREGCARKSLERRPSLSVEARGALRYGVGLGVHCAQCCAALTVALLVTGVMDLPGMLAATAAITLERLVPAGRRIPQLIGTLVLGAGVLLIGRASGLS